jgi:glycosyltransferase involved in cell wall biosynthesis
MGIKVSVIVPVYQTEQYLEKCLDSLIKQTLKEIEIVVVNDGSPDNSQAIIDRYQQQYSQIKSVQKENGGLSDARNVGVQCAVGEFVAFVDSDDYIESNMYEMMYNKAMSESLDIVVCDTFMDYPTHSYVLKANMGYTENLEKAYIITYPNAPARLIRTSLMKEHPFRKGIWYEDLDLMPTLAVYTDKIGFVNEPLYHYLQREASIMNQTEFRPKFKDIFTVMQDVADAYIENQKYEKYYTELEYLYITQLQRSAILRFAGIKGSKECMKKVHEIMKKQFPKWSKNPYFKQSSWKFRLICLLGAWKQYWAIALLKKIV